MIQLHYTSASKEVDYSDCLRVVLIGKTGNGKSATANSLIGAKAFLSKASQNSVTAGCQAVTFNYNSRKTLLVDTIGNIFFLSF